MGYFYHVVLLTCRADSHFSHLHGLLLNALPGSLLSRPQSGRAHVHALISRPRSGEHETVRDAASHLQPHPRHRCSAACSPLQPSRPNLDRRSAGSSSRDEPFLTDQVRDRSIPSMKLRDTLHRSLMDPPS